MVRLVAKRPHRPLPGAGGGPRRRGDAGPPAESPTERAPDRPGLPRPLARYIWRSGPQHATRRRRCLLIDGFWAAFAGCPCGDGLPVHRSVCGVIRLRIGVWVWSSGRQEAAPGRQPEAEPEVDAAAAALGGQRCSGVQDAPLPSRRCSFAARDRLAADGWPVRRRRVARSLIPLTDHRRPSAGNHRRTAFLTWLRWPP